MPIFKLTKGARQLLASCIEIGFEGADEENETADDMNTIAAILEELQESEADETVIHIAPTRLDEPLDPQPFLDTLDRGAPKTFAGGVSQLDDGSLRSA